MKALVVSLLLLIGVAMIVLAPRVGEVVSEIGMKPPQPAWSKQPAKEYKTDSNGVIRLLRIVGGVLILLALVVGILWRIKNAS
ncbi:MAG TPA: hypothetical protein VGH19_21945 [Verrucomicrobiae bacterium]